MWILFAALGALAKALTSVVRKKIADTNPAIYVFLSFSIISISLSVVTMLAPSDSLGTVKYGLLPLVLSGLVQTIAIRANMFAFRHEQLSYITPMFALTPLYAAIIGLVILNERPSAVGLAGIFAIVCGVYVVTSDKGIGLRQTATRILHSKGARVGMLIPIAYAVSATMNKAAINDGVTPLASVAFISAVMGLCNIYVLKTSWSHVVDTLKDINLRKYILIASMLGIASVGFAALALNEAFASYALGIRRLDVLITVLIGWKYMGDNNALRRIIGAVIMTIGVVMLSVG